MIPENFKPLLAMAWTVAHTSNCTRLHVGCVIAMAPGSEPPVVVGAGANGQDGSCTGEPGKCGCVHAEIRAMAAVTCARYMVAFTTHAPCLACAQHLVVNGVRQVFFSELYRVRVGYDWLLAQTDVETVQVHRAELLPYLGPTPAKSVSA